jgi:hypothetical protein
MDNRIELDHFLEKMEEAMPQQAALREPRAPARLQSKRDPQSGGMDPLQLYDELIALIELTQALLAEQPDGLTGAAQSGRDPRVLGLHLDRLRARRDFWAALASDCGETSSVSADCGVGSWQPKQR